MKKGTGFFKTGVFFKGMHPVGRKPNCENDGVCSNIICGALLSSKCNEPDYGGKIVEERTVDDGENSTFLTMNAVVHNNGEPLNVPIRVCKVPTNESCDTPQYYCDEYNN